MKYPVVNLNAVAKINNGFAFKSKDYVNSGYRVIRITNVQRGEIVDSEPKFISNEMALKYKPYQLFFGDLLISLTGNVGRVGVFKREHEPALLNQRVASIIIKSNKILPKYLFQYLNSSKFEQEAIIKSKGIAQLNLSSKWLETYKIPLPPIDEQIRIATLLNKVESLMAKRKKSIEDLDALLKSTFLEMFGDPVKNEMGWGKKRIGEFAKIRIGPFGSLLHAEDYVENGIPLINPKNIIEGKIVPNNSFSLSKKKYWELNDYHLKKNDIIVARRGEIGRCALVEKDTPLFCGTGSMFIRIAKDYYPIFLQFQIYYTSLKDLLESKSKGVTMKNLNSKILSNLEVLNPPITFQNKFAAIVEKVESIKKSYRKSLTDLENLYGTLSQKAFKGDLDLTRIPLEKEAETQQETIEPQIRVTAKGPEDLTFLMETRI